MILTDEQLSKIANNNKTEDWIKIAREDVHKLRLHYYGENTDEFLAKIQNLENSAQYELRKKYAVSNKFLTQNLLRPVDNAWAAKGGTQKILSETSEVLQQTLNNAIEGLKNQMSVKDYMKNVWFDRFCTDPNGLVFFQIKNDEPCPVYKSIDGIQQMEVTGIIPEWIKFEPVKEKLITGEEIETFIIVDDAYFRKYKLVDDKGVLMEEEVNQWGRVPAFQNSPIYDTSRYIKISPFWAQVELMDKYLNNGSIHEIYIFLHGYPLFWSYAQPCHSCKGTGEVNGKECSSCGGSGFITKKKDVSDGLMLQTPKDKDTPTIAPDVAGYVTPPLDVWNTQNEEQDRTWDLIYFSHWGTTTEKQANETATGRFIDTQPVISRLNAYSDIFELVSNKILSYIDQYYAPNTPTQIMVTYGRRYMIESPDQLLKKYLESKKEGADTSTLDLLLTQYYESEFQKNPALLDYHVKLMEVEPLVHYSLESVLSMEVPEEIKTQKTYFQDWKNSTNQIEVIDSTYQELKLSLANFTNQINNAVQV